MESILLITEAPALLPLFRQALLQAYPTAHVSYIDGDRLAVEFSTRVRLYLDDSGEGLADWDEQEIAFIRHRLPRRQQVYSISYRSVEVVKPVISLLANSADFIVDNDFGTLLPGPQFVRLMQQEPSWNWLTDLLDDQ